jgi:hypothetical protein
VLWLAARRSSAGSLNSTRACPFCRCAVYATRPSQSPVGLRSPLEQQAGASDQGSAKPLPDVVVTRAEAAEILVPPLDR